VFRSLGFATTKIDNACDQDGGGYECAGVMDRAGEEMGDLREDVLAVCACMRGGWGGGQQCCGPYEKCTCHETSFF